VHIAFRHPAVPQALDPYRGATLLGTARAVRRFFARRASFIPEADPNAAMVSVAEAIGHLPAIKAGESHPRVPNHKTRALAEINLKPSRPAVANDHH
jgi:hypothetical protein